MSGWLSGSLSAVAVLWQGHAACVSEYQLREIHLSTGFALMSYLKRKG